jgi:AhpD family alkylhydroperoxidase
MTHRKKQREPSDQPEGLGHCHRVSPEELHEWQKFRSAYDSVLDAKTEELIKVALSVASQCEWCIVFFSRRALKKGASRQEVIDSGRLAVQMIGGAALRCIDLLNNVSKEFEAGTEQAL